MRHMQVVVKLSERCNLNCQYCYMYTGPDQSWRTRPLFLSQENQELLVRRFVEHAKGFPDHSRILEIHGGEPLLFGKAKMEEFLSNVRRSLPPDILDVCLQTNAVLIDDEWLGIFGKHKVEVGISCDGPAHVHDEYRKFFSGRPTGALVESAIRKVVAWSVNSQLFGGILAVANPNFNGAELVRYFYELGVRQLDFLLPDANYVFPPTHLPEYNHQLMLEFMTGAFDQWIALGDESFQIRTFREMMLGIFGRKSPYDAFGGDPSSIAILESDGSYQLLDVLHICSEDATTTSLHIKTHSFRDFVSKAASIYPEACAQCKDCHAFKSCGGGYLPHRYDGHGYDNPSFYCDVLMGLFERIRNHVIKVTPAEMWRRMAA
jgi:uncharacterized protein